MNMQPANGNHFLAVKNRMEELQALIKSTEARAQYKRKEYNHKKAIAKRRKITLAEYDALFQTAPVDADFVGINSEIASLQAEIDGTTGPTSLWVLYATLAKQERVKSLEQSKLQTIADYHNGRANLSRQLTESEFDSLYPAPTDFATENTLISDSSIEVNLLHSFLKSGPYPSPGQYDIDLLTGTAISYP